VARCEGLRERIAPAYDQVDPARIWEIATRDLPQVAAAAEAALQRLDAKPK
jgi:uncharacterized protein with HEPN domain